MNTKKYSFINLKKGDLTTLDKKRALKLAAHEIFSQKGYKATSISDIARQAGMAVGSFYNYYDSKEAVFLEVYIDENNHVRQLMMDQIDWEADLVELVGQIFGQAREFVSSNKIMQEWHNPAISDELRGYYSSEKGKSSNLFHHFLLEKFTDRMQKEGYSPEEIQEILRVYQLFYYMDMHITEEDFPNISQATETLAIYFAKGILNQERKKINEERTF